MPAPSLSPDSSSHGRRLVVFVHGFGSSERCWSRILELLRADPRVAAALDVACFSYPTTAFELRFLRRIPRLPEIANSLAAFLESGRFAGYSDVTLVGHSQGGLVIHTYLAGKVRSGKSEDLRRIREVILIATPHQGSTAVSALRKLVYTFASNPQELALRVHNPDIADVLSDVDERIESIQPGDPRGWPVAIRCFNGQQDGVVLEASARGPFDFWTSVKGDHSSILQPDDATDPRYDLLADALLEPDGHAAVWEIDLYEQRIQIEPLAGSQQDILAKYGGNERTVHCDNVARITRRVRFSRKNRCPRPFTLRYATRNNGYIVPVMSHPNEAPPQDACAWENHGDQTVFKFTPKAGETYALDVTVYKGFDVGHRDVHFHLGRWEARYKSVRMSLDLRAYSGAGAKPPEPRFRFFEQETGHDEMCKQRMLAADPMPAVETNPDGLWTWQLCDVRGGIFDAVWDPVETGATAAAGLSASR